MLAASEVALGLLRERLAAKEAERTDVVTAAARECAVLETRLREATHARAALEAERCVACVCAVLCCAVLLCLVSVGVGAVRAFCVCELALWLGLGSGLRVGLGLGLRLGLGLPYR